MDFPFVGPAYQAASIYQDDQELINWFAEVDPFRKDRGVIALYPTPGLLQKALLATGQPVRALWTRSGGAILYAVCGSGLYSIDANFTATLVGTLLSSVGPVSMVDNSTSLYIVDGSNRYFYTWGTNTFTVVSDGAFNGATKVDIVDNFFIYNSPGSQLFGNSNASSVISGALNFGAADSAPDNLVSLIISNREAFFISEKHTEVWTDAGLFPQPLQRLSGASMQHGIAAPFSVTKLGESSAWLAQDDRGKAVVIWMNGYVPKRISTHAVENAIAGYGTISDAIAYSYQYGGHEFYVLTFPTADVTWVYDLASELWHKRGWRDSNNILHRHRGNCASVFQGQIVVGDYANGNLYVFSQSVFTDNGDAIPCVRRCTHLTDGLHRVSYHDLQIQFQPGVGLQSGQGSDPQAMLRWSDDGGSTWSNDHWASIGKVGKYKNRAIWRRLGQARDRIFEVVVTDPVFRVIVSAELNASVEAH